MKYLLIKALQKGDFQHEAYNDIDDKNLHMCVENDQ